MTKIKTLIPTFYFQLKAKYQDEFLNSIAQGNLAIFDAYMSHNISFKNWPQPLHDAVRAARYGTPESEYMVNALLEAGANPNSKYLNALGMALDNFVEKRGPGVLSFESYLTEKLWQEEEPQKSEIRVMQEGAFRVLTNLLKHNAVPNAVQQQTIDILRDSNPYFEVLLVRKDIEIAVPESQTPIATITAKRMRHKI